MAPRLQILHVCDVVDSPAITRAIADQARTIRIPVHMIETINKLVRTSRQLVQDSAANPPAKRSPSAWTFRCPGAQILKMRRNRSRSKLDREEEDSHLGDSSKQSVVSPSDAVINLNLKEQTSSVLKP